jgi:thioredoxin-like negative regulator of GroEL
MPLVVLKQPDYARLLDSLDDDEWIVVCFCAHWCKSCREYRPQLKSLSKTRKDVRFFWIDIEDHADMLGNLDIDKFPTILIQRGDVVAFYSCIHPDAALAGRILQSVMDESMDALRQQANSNEERRQWQRECNFRTLLQNALDVAA